MGKLALYSACAGIHPSRTLPVVFDVGTNNAQKLHDPLYVGLRQNRITPDEEKEFIDEFMQAVQKRWPGMVVQFEDVRMINRYTLRWTQQTDPVCLFLTVLDGARIRPPRDTS